MKFVHSKRLLVEGQDDKWAIQQLLSRHVDWPKDEQGWPARIDIRQDEDGEGGIEGILAEGYITSRLKETGVSTVGVVIDADANADGRWQRFRRLCGELFPDLPAACPREGLVAGNADGQHLGLWIMPDNVSSGMLENLLLTTIPEDRTALLQLARQTVETAGKTGAPFKDAHRDKALIHTWLAWQDPPGCPLGTALLKNILDPQSRSSAKFVDWFKRLFQC